MPKNKGKVSHLDPHQLFYCSFLSFFSLSTRICVRSLPRPHYRCPSSTASDKRSITNSPIGWKEPQTWYQGERRPAPRADLQGGWPGIRSGDQDAWKRSSRGSLLRRQQASCQREWPPEYLPRRYVPQRNHDGLSLSTVNN